MEALDDHDDVDAVHANFDIPAELLEKARPRTEKRHPTPGPRIEV